MLIIQKLKRNANMWHDGDVNYYKMYKISMLYILTLYNVTNKIYFNENFKISLNSKSN